MSHLRLFPDDNMLVAVTAVPRNCADDLLVLVVATRQPLIAITNVQQIVEEDVELTRIQ
jgi:hypothetical protein